MGNFFNVQTARFHIKHQDCYVLQGYFDKNDMTDITICAYLDKTRLPVKVTEQTGLEVRKKYLSKGKNVGREYYIWIKLPKDMNKAGGLHVLQIKENQKNKIFHISGNRLRKQQYSIDLCVDTISSEDGNKFTVTGWAAAREKYNLTMKDNRGNELDAQIQFHTRPDLEGNFPEGTLNRDAGFQVEFHKPSKGYSVIHICSQGRKASVSVGRRLGSGSQGASAPSYITKGVAYYRRYGLDGTIRRCMEKVMRVDLNARNNYDKWQKKYGITQEELKDQRGVHFTYEPMFSIVVPLYKTPIAYLKELVASIENQTYKNWEICLSDGSGPESPLTSILAQFNNHPQIKVIRSTSPQRISENTNQAISIAQGDYIVFADHDDYLTPDALFECVKALNKEPGIDMIYSDEDKVSMNGKEYFEPHFKSDFNPDLLCSMNYICHLCIVKKSLLDKVGGLRKEFDGAQDYDFVLRCSEQAEFIHHIPKVLYHWRAHKDSTAENPQSKLYAFEAGKRAVQAHYERIGVKAEVEMGEFLGLYRTHFLLPKVKPMISIIIPNKDHIDDLDKCIHSVLLKSEYPNIEILIIENNSVQEQTFFYYEKIQAEFENVRVVYWKDTFNYSRINNFGAEQADGNYLLFLNNDTELISENCLEELLGFCMREDVGVVGARLYFGDDTIQHAGVIIGYGGIAGHAFIGSSRADNGYFSRIICSADLSAVTAACMMVRRDVFEAVGGFDESLQVAFNDIDFCMKVRALGKLVVYNPHAELYHYESKSRGYEDTPEKIKRFNEEADKFLSKWPEILDKGDPYYNINLALDKADFSLKA